MKVVYRRKDQKLDPNRKIYECGNCGKVFNWDEENSWWYGSLKQLENQPEKIKYACSEKCAKKIFPKEEVQDQ